MDSLPHFVLYMFSQPNTGSVNMFTPDAIATTGPYTLLWLNEEDEHDQLARGLSLENAFERLLSCVGHEPIFERVGPSMVLRLGEETYRVSSSLRDPQEAKLEIMAAAVSHAWGEYAVEIEG